MKKIILKRIIPLILTAIFLVGTLVGCASDATKQLNHTSTGGQETTGNSTDSSETGDSSNNSSSSNPEPLSTTTVNSVVPGNFNYYDYFNDVYEFGDKATAYKATYSDSAENEQNPFYFSTRTHYTVNERSSVFPNYHPFSTLSYEEFYYLLDDSKTEDLGYYAIVFGGEWEEGIKDALYAVRDAAAEAVIAQTPTNTSKYTKYSQSWLPVIYNFDFKINGGIEIEERLQSLGLTANEGGEYNTDIRNDQTTYSSGRSTVTNLYKNLYTKLSDTEEFANLPNVTGTYSGKDANNNTVAIPFTEEAAIKAISSPSIVLIKKVQNADGTVENQVAGYVDLSTDPASKKDEIKALLNKAVATTDAKGNAISEGFREFDYFRYIWGSYTQGSKTSLAYSFTDEAPGSFTNEFTGENLNVQYDNLTDEDHIYRTVSYAELIHLLESDGSFAIYFGGAWCHYSRGFLAPFNQIARTYYVSEVYVFDPYIDGSSSATNIRSNESTGLFTRLYANILSYFGGTDYKAYGFPSENDALSAWMLDQKAAGNVLSGISNEDLTIGGQKFTKIGVPTLIGYRKGNYNSQGEYSPIFGTASSQLAFEEIVAKAESPTLYGELVKTENGVQYYKNVNYLSVFRTSASGRIVEYNVIKFLDDFLDGSSTYDIVEDQ